MEEHSPNIVATVEDIEDNEDVMAEPEPVPEKSMLKAKPKKPRSKAQKDAFARCQAARRIKLASKPDRVEDRVKDMPVEKIS